MKRTILIIIAIVVTISATATDRFYIEDFSIAAGETHMVSILLDNEESYTAFQTDLYLPEGLTVEQEDGEYIFDLTSRKARDHSISTQTQADGSIRLMSYSLLINAYSGNSGALVTFNIMASDDFNGSATITLRGTLFITTAGAEVTFADEECLVTSSATSLRGDVDDDGNVNIADVTVLIDYLLSGNSNGVNLTNADVEDDNVINIADVTALIDNLLTN